MLPCEPKEGSVWQFIEDDDEVKWARGDVVRLNLSWIIEKEEEEDGPPRGSLNHERVAIVLRSVSKLGVKPYGILYEVLVGTSKHIYNESFFE